MTAKENDEAPHVPVEVFWRLFRTSPAPLSISTAKDHRFVEVNDTWTRLTGYRRDEAVGRTPIELGLFENPHDFARLNHLLETHGGLLRDEECRFHTRSGSLAIGLVSADEFEIDGEVLRIVAVENITALRRSEETLGRATRELVRMVERERRRIARDLHDDIGQRVALLQIGIESLGNRLPADLQGAIEGLSRQAASIAADLRSVAHDLHSPKLGLLALDHVLKTLCGDVGSRLGLEVTFTSRGVPRDVPMAISSCLFRVLQEALTNAAKHSGSRRAEVELRGAGDAICLRVQDFGRGFSMERIDACPGIGLITMRERAALVGGTLTITSAPERGTRVETYVPYRGSKQDRKNSNPAVQHS